MEVNFTINGKPYQVNADRYPIDMSLNTYIRGHAQLHGTKFMCLEGGCGACLVTLKGIHPVTQELRTWAVNSCLTSVFACHGLDVITIEGIGSKKEGYHPVQKRLNELHGSQCGYCSPGMVMNMYSLLEAKDGKVSMEEIENSFGGNICRCTGYRPILDAFKSLAVDADQKLLDACLDIEDLTKMCPKTGSKCGGLCHKAASGTVKLLFKDDKQWYKVNEVQAIFDILDKIGNKPYMLVAGNTAHGVYRRSEHLQVFIDINAVKELRGHSIGAESLVIGANVNLTEAMEILTNATKSPGFEYCQHLVKHIDLIANVPVRNAGTIAGNLSIKHANKAFPSDMFLILESVGAQLSVQSSNKNETVSVADYVTFDMDKKVILNVTLPRLDATLYTFRSYKIMPRAQNAHAYVNAGFLFRIQNEKVESARICFGGINPDFIHASSTEKLVVGKDLYCNETLQAVLNSISTELQPDWVLPDASPSYRKNLAAALFYKFVLNTCPTDKVTPINISGGEQIDRPISSGTQTFDTHKEKYPLTQPVVKYEGLIQCSGEAKYINDLPYQKDELWAAFVPATKPHAKIGKIDASDALKIPGVHSFFSAKDIPGKNSFTPLLPFFFRNVEEVFVGETSEILFNGQPVGIILAENHALANYAATKVRITYYEDASLDSSVGSIYSMARSMLNPLLGAEKIAKPIITTIHELYALNARERLVDLPYKLDATQYGINTSKSLSGKFEIGAQYHYTMEPQTTICVPAEDGINVYSSTQWPDIVNIAVSEFLNIPENSINMAIRRLGGGYGGKVTRASQIACACALGTHLTHRPVRFVMTIESNMTTIGKRFALVSEYEIDVDDNGRIQKLINNFSEDSGCSQNDDVQMYTTIMFKNCYESDSWTVKSQSAITDAPSHTACRAPGTTEGIAMIEHMMEHIAYVTGKDPIDVRLANMNADNEIRKLIPKFLEDIEFANRKKAVEEFNAVNRWRKRGLSMVPMKYPIDYFFGYPAYVAIYHMDGTVAVSHGGVECGQGINTKVAQVTAHTLGIPLEMISVKSNDNLISANCTATGGSMTSEVVCFSIMQACKTLLERIKPVRDEMKDAKWFEVTRACNNKSIDLTAKYTCSPAEMKPYIVWGLSCAEIEIDILTGNIELKRIDILEDTGESMSPNIDVGQVEGAFVMGIGYWLTESLCYDRQNGELLTNRTWTYKPPGAKDIPVDFRITFLQKSSNQFGVLRSKATGEPSFCMAVVVIFALRHALNSARKDAGLPDDWYQLGSALTPDILFANSGNALSSFTL